MGIKHFFHWFKCKFADNIYKLNKGANFESLKEQTVLEEDIIIDNLMIDMNGIFHNAAQKIYEYGNHKPRHRLLGNYHSKPKIGGLEKQIECFNLVCQTIEKVLNIVKPKKRIVMCVDGPAPLSKQNQQRQRRFLSALDKESDRNRTFDSNAITPGTKFMDYLTKYIDWYIRSKMSEDTINCWSNIEVIFSNEKAPGEGEHKIINYIRRYGSKDESYCINGMDADLIMLSLGTHLRKFFLLREEPMDPAFDFYVIDIGGVRHQLSEMMMWNTSDQKFDTECAINDFIFMCFTVGNDFLPNIPGIEIREGGIDFMIDVYKNICEFYGHITRTTPEGVKFVKTPLKSFLGTLSQYEKGILEEKLLHRSDFIDQDLLLEKNSTIEDGKFNLDIESYRKHYYESKLENIDLQTLCHSYLEGMQWVLTYYTQGVPNWKWRFPYHYAPFAFTLAEHVMTFNFPNYTTSIPTVPFIQLLSVLPPKSAHLLPEPLNQMLISEQSPISKFCPKDFEVDLTGKRKEWEGVVLLPIVDYPTVEKEYFKVIQRVDERERKRNILGKSFLYRKSPSFEFQSYYGKILCKVTPIQIDL